MSSRVFFNHESDVCLYLRNPDSQFMPPSQFASKIDNRTHLALGGSVLTLFCAINKHPLAIYTSVNWDRRSHVLLLSLKMSLNVFVTFLSLYNLKVRSCKLFQLYLYYWNIFLHFVQFFLEVKNVLVFFWCPYIWNDILYFY